MSECLRLSTCWRVELTAASLHHWNPLAPLATQDDPRWRLDDQLGADSKWTQHHSFPGCSGLQVRWRNAFPYFLLRILVRIWDFFSIRPSWIAKPDFLWPKGLSQWTTCLFEEQFQSHSSYWPVAIFEASRPFLMLILLIAGRKMIMMISGPRECTVYILELRKAKTYQNTWYPIWISIYSVY